MALRLRGIGEPPAPLGRGREWKIYLVAIAAVFAVAMLMYAVTRIKLGPDVVRWTFSIVVLVLAGRFVVNPLLRLVGRVQVVVLVGPDAVAAQLVPAGHAPDVGDHTVIVGQ